MKLELFLGKCVLILIVAFTLSMFFYDPEDPDVLHEVARIIGIISSAGLGIFCIMLFVAAVTDSSKDGIIYIAIALILFFIYSCSEKSDSPTRYEGEETGPVFRGVPL
jgi:hypothetical protein